MCKGGKGDRSAEGGGMSESAYSVLHMDADDQDTTMKLYGGIVNWDDLHHQAFVDLSAAFSRGDVKAMKVHFDACVFYEQMSRQAAIETRKHLLSKAASHG